MPFSRCWSLIAAQDESKSVQSIATTISWRSSDDLVHPQGERVAGDGAKLVSSRSTCLISDLGNISNAFATAWPIEDTASVAAVRILSAPLAKERCPGVKVVGKYPVQKFMNELSPTFGVLIDVSKPAASKSSSARASIRAFVSPAKCGGMRSSRAVERST